MWPPVEYFKLQISCPKTKPMKTVNYPVMTKHTHTRTHMHMHTHSKVHLLFVLLPATHLHSPLLHSCHSHLCLYYILLRSDLSYFWLCSFLLFKYFTEIYLLLNLCNYFICFRLGLYYFILFLFLLLLFYCSIKNAITTVCLDYFLHPVILFFCSCQTKCNTV